MKLYVMAGACSMVPHTALEWSGADYHIELVSLADTKTDSYLAMNPQGAVPLLVENKQEDDFILSQNVAILEYVDSLYPNAGIFGPMRQTQKVSNNEPRCGSGWRFATQTCTNPLVLYSTWAIFYQKKPASKP